MRSRELVYYFQPEELGLEAHAPPAATRPPTATPETPRVSVSEEAAPPPQAGNSSGEPRAEVEAGTLEVSPEPANGQPSRRFGVHALGQFAFCPRSAMLALETGDPHDVDDPPIRLDYLPNYDVERIDEALSEACRVFWAVLLVAGILGIAMLKGVLEPSRLWLYPSFLLFVPAGACLIQVVTQICHLCVRRLAAVRAQAETPPPDISEPTPVDWWSLRKAGFEPVAYDEPFRHPELPLEGQPWRVLERGSDRIPVIRSANPRLGPAEGVLYPKHCVRLAAYAALLEAIPGVASPYGVVLSGNSTRGIAVPITPAIANNTLALLERFSETVRLSADSTVEPSPPSDKERCRACRHGAPVKISEAEARRHRQAGKSLLVLFGPQGGHYHCVCGDRFGSAPPHKRTLEKQLLAVVE